MTTAIAHWIGPSVANPSGDFDAPSNWKSDSVPGATTRTLIDATGGYVVTSSADNTVASLTLTNSAAILDIASGTFSILGTYASLDQGTIEVSDGATLKLAGALTDDTSISIRANGDPTAVKIHGTMALKGDGELTIDGIGAELLSDGAPARLINYTSMSGDGMVGDADLTLINHGVIAADGTTALAIETTATVGNYGTMDSVGAGGLSILHNLNNDGSLAANGGNVKIGGSIGGAGSDSIANATLEVGRAVGADQSILFFGNGTLKLDVAQSFAGTVSTFDTSDSIDLSNFVFAGHPTIASATSTTVHGISATAVTITDGKLTATLDLLNQFGSTYSTDPGAYQLVSDNDTANGHRAGTLFQLAASATA